MGCLSLDVEGAQRSLWLKVVIQMIQIKCDDGKCRVCY